MSLLIEDFFCGHGFYLPNPLGRKSHPKMTFLLASANSPPASGHFQRSDLKTQNQSSRVKAPHLFFDDGPAFSEQNKCS